MQLNLTLNTYSANLVELKTIKFLNRYKNNKMENKKVKLQNMDISNPIDVATAVKGLGGEKSIFLMMLSKLEDMTLK